MEKTNEYQFASTIGQDSHAFDMSVPEGEYHIKLGGVDVKSKYPISANSDGDVLLHAITNAVSGFSSVNILGKIADKMCLEEGITDSKAYLYEALSYLKDAEIIRLSVSIECLSPKISPVVNSIRENLSSLLALSPECIGITATTGEGLTAFGRGEGISVFAIMSFKYKS